MDKLAARELLHVLVVTSILWRALWCQADVFTAGSRLGDEF